MSGMANKKTRELLAYLAKNRPNASVTVLMKLAYFVDLISTKERGQQVTSFEYVRYNFGPFTPAIYPTIEELVKDNILSGEARYARDGNEYTVYTYTAEEAEIAELTPEEMGVADRVIDTLSGYGVRMLSEAAYKTKPMRKLKATIGGTEGIGEKLQLDV